MEKKQEIETAVDRLISIVKAYAPLPDIHKELEDYFESLSMEDVYRRMTMEVV